MALVEISATFLVLVLVAPPVLADDQISLCNKNFTSVNPDTNFTLSVSPDDLRSNTSYKVDITGNVHVTVILRAEYGNSSSGNWNKDGSIKCDRGILFNTSAISGSGSQWISPQNLTINSINISAFIINGNETSQLTKTLKSSGSATQPQTVVTFIIQVFGMLVITRKLFA